MTLTPFAVSLHPRSAPSGMAFPGDRCSGLSSCAGGSTCEFGRCICPIGQAVFAKQCVFAEEIIHQGIKKSEELNYNLDGTTDQELFATPAGFFCLQSQYICARGLGKCENGWCVCNDGFHSVN